jgi:hypothetical protein
MAWNRKRKYPKKVKKGHEDSIYPFKSMLEKRLASVLFYCRYESRKLKYSIPHTYNPDFDFPDKDWCIIEAKGRFINGTSEAKKYIEVAKQHKEIELVFIFERALTKAYTSCKKRRDGSVMTLGEWACKNNFLFFDEKSVPQWFAEGDFNRQDLIDAKKKLKQEWLGK